MKRIVCLSLLMVGLLGMFANIGFAAEMKTVVLLATQRKRLYAEEAVKALEQEGFVDQQNVTIRWAPASVVVDPTQLAAWVQTAAADVLISFESSKAVHDRFESLSIPVISHLEVERFVNAEGVPTANVTGLYTTLPDMAYNSYKFLQKVAPLKEGQKVVFLDGQDYSFVSLEEVETALQRSDIPLKEVVNISSLEDWRQAILKYNEDPEIGWVLFLEPPAKKLDGSAVIFHTEVFQWYGEHAKKPMITYWEPLVQGGFLCAFAVSFNEIGRQLGEMAARVLQGEPIRAIHAEYPRKVSIALNRKTATNLGIIFSLDVLDLANVIYDDYEGKQVIRK